MTETTKGFLAILGTCVIWGLSGIYYKWLSHVPPIEVLAHRTVWSLVFFGAIILAQGRIGILWRMLSGRSVLLVAVASVTISLNWFVYIWSVTYGHVVEASLGYFIFPLVAVALGAAVYRERLGRAQALAVGLALVAVCYLTWGLGVAPWIALTLALTMGVYGMVKKKIAFGSDITVTGEVALLAPLALAWLAALHFGWGVPAESGAFGSDWTTSLLLMFSGVLTGGPLVLFAYGAQRVRLGTLGILFYVNPTLQFLVAVMLFGEPLTPYHLVAFPVIWAALVIYSAASLRASAQPARA
ncbi:EamA family transporter RarD [Paenirhodobacter populi]|uniref:EamA family transporter RarD n=1 Tax=Paenirhodobacter populi TaxID=2306993 RepID=A0A443KN15_9RHOB|nr:EamA family transporter RarD [Sinirhodobacter populi]RWR09341.1 EamA family transporter RarD [Sinirhodobacter populi]RWR34179.1 EamA family transporter RarD [Sinirhodobacter populi]